MQQYQGDTSALTSKGSFGHSAATELIYSKNSPSYSDVQVEDAGDKAIVKLTNARTGLVEERSYPHELVRFNQFLDGVSPDVSPNTQANDVGTGTPTQTDRTISSNTNARFNSETQATGAHEESTGENLKSNAVNPIQITSEKIAQLEQQLSETKSVPQRNPIKQQIGELNSQLENQGRASWENMSPEQRQAVVGQIDTNMPLGMKKRLPTAEWDRIGPAVKEKLIGVMGQSFQPFSQIDTSAHEAATSHLNDIPQPTQAQIEAGNYKKGHVRIHGLDISIENPKGSTRSGTRPDGTEWSHDMSDHYGYIKRTKGADNEHIDTYIGNNPDSDQVYIVDQLDQQTGNFDEHKVMLGFDNQDAATKAYQSNFDKGWKVGPIRSMNIEQFKDWLKNEDTSKPVADIKISNSSQSALSEPVAPKNIKEGIENIRAEQNRQKVLVDMHNSVYGLASNEQLQESLKHLNKEIVKAQKQSENEVVNGKRSTRKAVAAGALDRFLKNRVDLEMYIKARKNGELKQRNKKIDDFSRNTKLTRMIQIQSQSEIDQIHFIPSHLMDSVNRLGDVVNDLASMRTDSIKTNHEYAVKLLNEIVKSNPNVLVHIVSDLNSIEDTSIRANLTAGGFFVPEQNTVYIYPSSEAWNSSALELLNHELVHSITEQYISKGLMSLEDIGHLDNFINIINDYRILSYEKLSDDVRDRLDYAVTTNPHHEILSVGVAETAVRQELKNIIGEDGLQQLYKIFTNISIKEKQYEQHEQRGNSGRNSKGNDKDVSKSASGISEKIQKGFVKAESDNGIKRDTGNPSGDLSGNENSEYSNTQLEADNNFEWTESINRVFGIFTQNRAIEHIISFFNHFKMSTTQDASISGRIKVTLGRANLNNVGDLDTASFTVQVVSSFNKLPKIIQDNATYQDENGVTNNYSVSGVWHNDTLYIVTDQIYGNIEQQLTTSDAYEELLAHEVIGHFGVQQLFGDEYQSKFQQLYNVLGGIDGIRNIAKNNGVDMQQFESAYIDPFKKGVEEGYYSALDAQQAVVGELFAFIAQNAETRPFVRQKLKEVIGYIRQWFRDHGFSKFLSRYNDADLIMFLSEARKAVVDRRYFGKFKDQTISTNNSDKLFSRGQSTTRTDTTVKQVRDKLVSRFGEETISKLEIQEKLNILDTYEKAGVEGFYQSGKATLIADALTNDTIIPTFLHELGGHGGFQNMMDAKQYDDLMHQFDRLVAQNNPIALEAKRLAERETDPEVQHLEMLPYLLTLASNNQIKNAVHKGNVKRLISDLKSKIKAWVYDRLGVNLNLDTNDIVALAERMIDKGTTKAAQSNQPLYSRQPINSAINRLSQNIKQMSVKSIKDKTGYKWTDWLGIGLSSLGRRQLTEIYSKILPQLNKYNELAAQMDADKNDAGAEADSIVREWANLKDENQLAELMHDATLAKIDPSKPYVSGDSISKYKQLRDDYNSLSPEAQAMYLKARDAYKKHYAKVHQAIKERILRSELTNHKKADLLKQMDNQFFGYTKGVYFPLARFGKYVVVMRNQNGDVECVSRAETMGEAQALRSELMQKYPNFKVDRVILDKEFNASRDAVGRGFMTSLFAEVDNLGLSTAEQAEFEDTLSQLYLSSMPDLSWAKHGIHRKGTAGFSQDARRAFAQNMFHGAGYLAKLRYGDQLAEQLDDMQKYATEQGKQDDTYDQPTAQRVIDEMNKRHDLLMNPKSHPLSSGLTSLGFIYYLGLSPAAAMVNLSQTTLVAYPIMGAKWGFDKAATELLKASNDFRKGVEFHKVKWEGTKTDLYKTISADISKFLNKDEKQAYDSAVASGVIDVTQAHDLAGIAQGEDSGIMWKTRPIMRAASVMFHNAERFNREVTFIAAYRLARQSGSNHDAAYTQAVDATYKGHFDYSSGNRPRIMQGNVAKVLLLFKQFGQNMIYTLARQTYQSIKGETDAQRKEARKSLGAILAMHATFAGVLGLPGVWLIMAIASAWGGDDDEPWDAEVALRNYLAEAFNPTISNMLMKGAPRGVGIDLSGRVGINNLLLPDVQEGLEGKRWAESAMAGALGPVAGIGTNLIKGGQELSDGHTLRGMETMLPVFLKNFAKTYRYGDEGVQDKTGISIMDEVSSMDLLVQGMGFSPSDVRTANEGKSAIYQLNRKLNERRSRLVTLWSRAKMMNDQNEMDKIWEEIQQFNEKNPSRRINRINLNQSYKNRKNRIDKAEDGIYLSRNRQDAREAGRFAFGE
ncbi:PLxRFG domain-containing protein [Acinetobacter modestus]|uniref:PLxRFG domain-containing protein n=1 Tax=Acinetobacter modestus TaxID=1776740 RepID=UPI001D177A75|nr:PLxRFG domain-containing protein [Acinetobacter modestus]